jgi:TolB-like protein
MENGSPVHKFDRAIAHRTCRLNSWKEIAAYMATSVRTVQRWEQTEGLPIHRHEHASVATVYAYTSEVDAWFVSRTGVLQRQADILPEATPSSKRIIILPFRLIQPDLEIEFLAFGLADAIAASLSGLDSLAVRSSMVAAKYAGDIDLVRIAKESAVNFILTGTLLRSGNQLRVNAQLVEAVSGTVVWSQTSQASLQNVFQLQDHVAARIVDALALPSDAREQRLSGRDVPASPAAYEYYLRANELAYDFNPAARDLYVRCLEEDPHYAPAWAHLGRCYRITAKFGGARRTSAALKPLWLEPWNCGPTLRRPRTNWRIWRRMAILQTARWCAFCRWQQNRGPTPKLSPAWCTFAVIAACSKRRSAHMKLALD